MGQFTFREGQEPPADLLVTPAKDEFEKLTALRLERNAPADFPHGINFGGNRSMAFIELDDDLLARIDPKGKAHELVKKYGKTAALLIVCGGCSIIEGPNNDISAFAKYPEAAFRAVTNGPFGPTDGDMLFVIGNLTEGVNALYEAGMLLPKWRGMSGFLNTSGIGAIHDYEQKHPEGPGAFRTHTVHEDLQALISFFQSRYGAVPEVFSKELHPKKLQRT